MCAREVDEFEGNAEEVCQVAVVVPEASPSTRLARRRKIEDLFEEKRLREEIAEFG